MEVAWLKARKEMGAAKANEQEDEISSVKKRAIDL
jgi:hypothetical protein